MTLATFVDTVQKLGIPALIGTVVGAVIAHYAARVRERELLVSQDERRAAHRVLEATRAIANRIRRSPDAHEYGLLHDEWAEEVWAPARLVRSDDLIRRARAGAYLLSLAALDTPEFLTYSAIRATEDVEEWVEAWLRGDEPPPPHLPPFDEIGKLVRAGGVLRMTNLNDLLIVESAGGPTAYRPD
jgi:hypothetical protein